MAASSGATALDPVFHAMHRFKQHRYDECITLCSEVLAQNPYDQAVWYLKCRALTMQRYVKDDEWGGSMSAWRENARGEDVERPQAEATFIDVKQLDLRR